MITIVDYDAGNIKSIQNMLRAIGATSMVSKSTEDLARASKIILPGVGHFDYGMGQLRASGLVDVLNLRVARDRTPLLGICLGAQLLTRGSEEGRSPGLGWIDAQTVKFDRSRMHETNRVPHIGWSQTVQTKQNPLSQGLGDDARFYFVHSYHIACDDPDQEILRAHYGYDFTCGVQKDNILGVQFHPEKSHRFGMQLLRNFVAWTPASKNAPMTATA